MKERKRKVWRGEKHVTVTLKLRFIVYSNSELIFEELLWELEPLPFLQVITNTN
jgi:hypothetical protein